MSLTVDSKQKLLDAAEQLFAEKGFHATSLRRITAAAGVNLAAVNYHFGSKDGLIAAVFERYILPINNERLRLLDEIEARTAAPRVEELVVAFVAPPFRFRHAHRQEAELTMRLYGRTHAATNPGVHAIFRRQFGAVRARFSVAFARALPDLPSSELSWRLHFLIGTMAQTMADPDRLVALSDGHCDPSDIDATLSHLVPFLTAGLCAPVAGDPPGQRRPKSKRKQGRRT